MSRCLDLDVGNTRTKWRVGGSRGWLISPNVPLVSGRIDRVRVSNVAIGMELFEHKILEAYGVKPEFAKTTAMTAGVRCGYLDPTELGVDRWLAILAAWNKVKLNCVVIGAGTALTVDFVTRDGNHIGGYIVPGLTAMGRSLNDETSGINVRFDSTDDLSPAAETTGAVNRGILLMTTSFISSCTSWLQAQSPGEFRILISGGNAEVIASHIDCTTIIEPGLVLDGLNLALP